MMKEISLGRSGIRTGQLGLECGPLLKRSFAESRAALAVPDMGDAFTRKLYATYLSYLPEDAFAYPLCTHAVASGSFTEFSRTPERGHVSVNGA